MFYRGLKELPPRGTVADKLLIEMHGRERRGKVLEWELSMKTLGQFLGMAADTAKTAVYEAKQEMERIVNGDAFDIRYKMALLQQRLERMRGQRHTLERVDKMSSYGTKLATIKPQP